jgi:hypothetical protein
MVDVPPTVILWTVPRGCGNDPPPRPAELPASFRAVFEAFRERAAMAPTFLRSAAYAVMNHLGEVDWSGMRHCILIRDPRYVLPSHRRFVPDITVEEAGYVAQRRLYRHLAASAATPPLVLDAHELLSEPAALLRRLCRELGIPFRERALVWEPGFRPRWGLWPRWKAHAAASHGFQPFAPDRRREAEGRADPLFAQCWSCYRELFAVRLRPTPELPDALPMVAGLR